MRILGFEQHWGKLDHQLDDLFSTFRYPRRDKDWQRGERVNVVVKPRTKGRQCLGLAKIINICPVHPEDITDEMAQMDGFTDAQEMLNYLAHQYAKDERWLSRKPINQLLLAWLYRTYGYGKPEPLLRSRAVQNKKAKAGC